MHTVTERLWLTEDRQRVVPEGDPAARFLFATPGTRIHAEDARRYGLVSDAGDQEESRPVDQPAGDTPAEDAGAVADDAATKAVTVAPANKQRRAVENKSR